VCYQAIWRRVLDPVGFGIDGLIVSFQTAAWVIVFLPSLCAAATRAFCVSCEGPPNSAVIL
jgi:hypothetical protein